MYDADIDESRWIDSHEAGRLLVDEMTGDNVVTEAYICEENNVCDAIEKAVSDGCGIVFTVSPSMLRDAVKASVKYPDVKILNCSFGKTAASVRCYYGRMYEASFLMGILAADRLLTECSGNVQRKIGYLARTMDNTSVRVLNAFAVGVSMIDPECRISLKCDNPNAPHRYRREWAKEGVQMFADFDCSSVADVSTRAGLFLIKEDKDVYLGKPYFNWGKYYVQMVQSVLSGIWDISEKMKISVPTNYWFGLSTGVVDIITPKAPYQTKKLLAFMKNAIVHGGMDPFSGELRSKDGIIIQQSNSSGSRITADQEKMKTSEIAAMEWLNENIDGEFEF
nr:BMP family ABC transporter substrate-binding protein [Ruminococcus albus]